MYKDGSKFYTTFNSGATGDLVNHTTFGLWKAAYYGADPQWCTKADGTGTCFNKDDNYTYATYKAAATEQSTYYNLKLYAHWTPKPVKISYLVNSGTISSSTYSASGGYVYKDGSKLVQTVNLGATGNLYAPSTFGLTRSGYHIVGDKEWCTNSAGTGTCFDESADLSYTTFKNAATAQTTYYELNLYAHWQKNATTYSCRYRSRTWVGYTYSCTLYSSFSSYPQDCAKYSSKGYTYTGGDSGSSGTCTCTDPQITGGGYYNYGTWSGYTTYTTKPTNTSTREYQCK